MIYTASIYNVLPRATSDENQATMSCNNKIMALVSDVHDQITLLQYAKGDTSDLTIVRDNIQIDPELQ